MSAALAERIRREELQPVAVVYQAVAPPAVGGVHKPMKPGGYSDSGADIAHALRAAGIAVVTPAAVPDPADALQWAFPDSGAGLADALARGARVIWANTVLFAQHPLERLPAGMRVVGQVPADVERFDDKWVANELLRASGCTVAHAVLAGYAGGGVLRPDELTLERLRVAGLAFPLVLKPVRGRGSEGVRKVDTLDALRAALDDVLPAGGAPAYGDRLILEEFLSGQEITVTVMPPGAYEIAGRFVSHARPWALPPVARFNHADGIAPYNGTVAVVRNSRLMPEPERATAPVQRVVAQCETAAAAIRARAPIRVDCRAGDDGEYRLFDCNMKPNMTGSGRPGRADEDSLTAIAARAIGWSYTDLLLNMLAQAWAV